MSDVRDVRLFHYRKHLAAKRNANDHWERYVRASRVSAPGRYSEQQAKAADKLAALHLGYAKALDRYCETTMQLDNLHDYKSE